MSPKNLPKFHHRVVKILEGAATSPYETAALEGSHRSKQPGLLGYMAMTKRSHVYSIKVSDEAPEAKTAIKRVLGYSVSKEVSQRSTLGDKLAEGALDLGTVTVAGQQVGDLPVAIIGFYGTANDIKSVVLWYVDIPQTEETSSRYLYLIQKRLNRRLKSR